MSNATKPEPTINVPHLQRAIAKVERRIREEMDAQVSLFYAIGGAGEPVVMVMGSVRATGMPEIRHVALRLAGLDHYSDAIFDAVEETCEAWIRDEVA